MEDEEVRSSVSRRRIIKRAGVGAAIVWSAPVLTSLGAHAQAATPVGSACDPSQGCDPACAAPRECQGDPGCHCFQAFDLSCWCGDLLDNFCSSFDTCTSDADCDPGSKCVDSCCPAGICAPACGAGGAGAGTGEGPTVTL